MPLMTAPDVRQREVARPDAVPTWPGGGSTTRLYPYRERGDRSEVLHPEPEVTGE